ncbi:unnamed protein product [Closterium sp. Naga37s-1]|nr:unnamed protein product [Closterium sp. Naga37s-1]
MAVTGRRGEATVQGAWAAIVLFHEKEHELYETVTSYKFQFCLFFLADILGDMNDLNRSFQKRQVDVTEVAKTVESITGDLEHRYLDTNALFGGSGNGWLSKFLTLYGKKSGQKSWHGCRGPPYQPLIHPAREDDQGPHLQERLQGLPDDRKRKGKEPEEGEEGPSEPALEEEFVESDDEGDEREMDQEIEEEEDNPFLSDGEEEGEETYHMDKPLH